MQVNLDGVTYTMQMRWNNRASAWFFDILDEDAQNVLAAGIRMVVDFPLNLYKADRKPPGMLLAMDSSGAGAEPGADELGDRVQLVYFSSAELAEMGL
jgi:hypothetical protein